MQYLFLIYADEAVMRTWSEEDMYRCLGEAAEYEERLKRGGHLVVAHGLEWASQATTLRKNSGKLISTDGPFAETKEQLLGFFLVNAQDRAEALALAEGLPMLETSTMEVRAVEDPAAADA